MSNTSESKYPTVFGGREIGYVYSTGWLKDRSLVEPKRETYTTPDGLTTTEWLTFTLLRDATFRAASNDEAASPTSDSIYIKKGATWMCQRNSDAEDFPELPDLDDVDDWEGLGEHGESGTWSFVPYKGLHASRTVPSNVAFRPDFLLLQEHEASQEPTDPSAESS